MTILSSDPSPGSEVEDQAIVDPVPPVDTGIDANPASSSVADDQGAKEPLDLLSVVKAAVEPKAPEASPAPEGDQVDPEIPVAEAETPEAPKVEDDADLPFHTHPRFKALIEERNQLKDPAERYGQIQSFMDEAGLQPPEVAEGFEIMALLKSGTPEGLGKAREWFVDRLAMLDGALGHVLPDDLRQKVEDGLMDEEAATEVAQLRATKELTTQRNADEAKRAETNREAETAQRSQNEVVSAITAWEERTKASDPDYAKKAKLIETACRAIVHSTGKAPTNAAEATALAEQALKDVNAELKAMLPKPRTITPPPTGSSAIATAAPKTLREAIEASLSK